MEIWKDIKGYEGIYQISNHGNVKSFIPWRGTDTRILKTTNNGHGYLSVGLKKNNKPKIFYVHRLVAQAFIENSLNKPEVNHKYGTKGNNYSSNLEWCTLNENRKHAVETGLVKHKGESNQMSKFSEKVILSLRKEFANGCITRKELSEKYGISKTHVVSIINKSRWTHI